MHIGLNDREQANDENQDNHIEKQEVEERVKLRAPERVDNGWELKADGNVLDSTEHEHDKEKVHEFGLRWDLTRHSIDFNLGFDATQCVALVWANQAWKAIKKAPANCKRKPVYETVPAVSTGHGLKSDLASEAEIDEKG